MCTFAVILLYLLTSCQESFEMKPHSSCVRMTLSFPSLTTLSYALPYPYHSYLTIHELSEQILSASTISLSSISQNHSEAPVPLKSSARKRQAITEIDTSSSFRSWWNSTLHRLLSMGGMISSVFSTYQLMGSWKSSSTADHLCSWS